MRCHPRATPSLPARLALRPPHSFHASHSSGRCGAAAAAEAARRTQGWEKCVEEAEEADGDVVERCYEAIATLRKCMDAHAKYYKSILPVERAMAEDLKAAKAREAADTSSQPTQPLEEEAAGKNQAVVQEKEDAMA
ncbi:hypothetical protein ABZP36_027929 [Zizania latifolia]